MRKLSVFICLFIVVFVINSKTSYSDLSSPGLLKAMKEEGLAEKKIKLICEKEKLYSEFSHAKHSAVEGKLVDWKNNPVAGVKILASQVKPIKGYEQFEAVTKSDGTFRLSGLFPSSEYVLKPLSDKWTCKTRVGLDSAPQNETAMLPTPMVIKQAFSKSGGSLVIDLATGAARFTVSSDGVISDSETRLEWVVGPDKDTTYMQASQWVASCKTAGGGWRMPRRKELKTLYLKGIGKRNMDPAFKTTGWWVWAEPRSSSSAWGYAFLHGPGGWSGRPTSGDGGRVFAIDTWDQPLNYLTMVSQKHGYRNVTPVLGKEDAA